jgi:hypothetical protein
MRDLEPSQLAVHARVGLATLVGGFFSLVICGQFGLGVTRWADALNHQMHAHLDPLTCAVACGVLYAIFPIALLRFVLTPPLLFRVILKKHQPVLFLWFAGFGGLLTLMGDHGQGIFEYGAWVVAALIAANLMARAVNLLVPTWYPQLLLRPIT